jgi:O-acetyl-ADP-ribose deacetylase (regulator of RNase III)
VIVLRDTVVELVQGDITAVVVDAIVNAANSRLAGGGGVDGAIHRAGGPAILRECRALGGCPTGCAVHTGAGLLHARHVVHAVAPRWRGGSHDEASLLAGTYRAALELADRLGARSIAFPSLGTGIYGYPVTEAAVIASRTVRDHILVGTGLTRITVVLFSAADLVIYQAAVNSTFGGDTGQHLGEPMVNDRTVITRTQRE